MRFLISLQKLRNVPYSTLFFFHGNIAKAVWSVTQKQNLAEVMGASLSTAEALLLIDQHEFLTIVPELR